jgi:error-prone DNA polymerase
MADLVRRTGLSAAQVEALATAGVFDCFGLTRRQALWEAGRAAEERPERFAGVTAVGPPPTLPGMSDDEVTIADLWATGITSGKHPIQNIREQLTADGILSAAPHPPTPESAPPESSPTANAPPPPPPSPS